MKTKSDPTDSRSPRAGNSILGRRAFLQLGSAGTLVGLAGLPASGAAEATASDLPPVESPLPIVDARFPCRIADGVWVIPDKRIPLVPNIGIVEGDHSVLVIDAGLTPACGAAVLEAARFIAGKRELILTVTHAHPEHTFGAQAFKDSARIYYNRMQRDYLLRSGEKLRQGFRGFLPSAQQSLLDEVRITPAGEVYDTEQTVLDLGGRKVELWSPGIAHSPGDQIILIPDQNIIFAGDLIEERMFPIVPFFPPLIEAADIDVPHWRGALKRIEELSPRIIVPGHGNLGGTEIASEVRAYLEKTREQVTAANGGKTLKESKQNLVALILAGHPTWERSSFIEPAIQYFASQTKE